MQYPKKKKKMLHLVGKSSSLECTSLKGCLGITTVVKLVPYIPTLKVQALCFHTFQEIP